MKDINQITEDIQVFPVGNREEILKELNLRYDQIKARYHPLIDDVKQKASRKVINKGYLQNVIPFENELRGDKLVNKPLPDLKKDCKVYYFDNEDRILLIEDYRDYLEIPGNYTLYDYTNEKYIEKVYGQYDYPLSVEYNYLKEEKVYFKVNNYCNETYVCGFYDYEKSKLTHIKEYMDYRSSGVWNLRGDYDFIYNEKEILTHILFTWSTGGVQYCYSTSKTNYKQLEERLKEEIGNAFRQFIEEHPQERVTRIAIEGGTGHLPSYITLSLDTQTDENLVDSTEDWEYFDIKDIQLFNFPLDDAQEEKTLKTIALVILSLMETDWLKELLKQEGFKIVFLNHHGEVAEDYPRIGKLMKNPVFQLR